MVVLEVEVDEVDSGEKAGCLEVSSMPSNGECDCGETQGRRNPVVGGSTSGHTKVDWTTVYNCC